MKKDGVRHLTEHREINQGFLETASRVTRNREGRAGEGDLFAAKDATGGRG